MKKTDPVFLNNFKIKLPLMGFVSIVQRIFGVLLVISIPWVIYAFQLSLSDADSFNQIAQVFKHPAVVFLGFLFMAAFVFHFFAGLRLLLIDLGIGLDIQTARRTSWLVIVASIFSVLILFVFRLI